MVKLARFYGKSIDLFEGTASVENFAFERLHKESRSFIADGFPEPLLTDEFSFVVGLGLFRPFRQCTEAHLFDVVFIAKGKQTVHQLIMLLDPHFPLASEEFSSAAL